MDEEIPRRYMREHPLYGFEIWRMGKADRRILEAHKIDYFRKMFG